MPIIQAPMAGGPSSPELVAASAAAGALGCFGFAYTQAADMDKQAAWVRERTQAPFLINLFTSPQPGEVKDQHAALAAVAHFYAELGLGTPQPVQPPYAPDLEAQLAAVERIRPRAFT
ncbi:MAG TPA: nitronate monooxygenase, partial [Hyphomicrobiaceae bacterium]|nr:nitronate monooxygenase [Hyphomicrobiaceae bacterium]